MDRNIDFLISMHLAKLQREGLPSLTFAQLKYVLNQTIWLVYKPVSISAACADINKVTAKEVVDFLTDKGKIKNQLDRVNNELKNPFGF